MNIKKRLLKAALLLAGSVWNMGAMAQTANLCPDSNHPHLIDLGLPSGTKWACCNVGASSPQDYGNYYAWGETVVKDYYHWDSYQYGNANLGQCQSIGSDISGTQYDAARAEWKARWQMPTQAQVQELLANCTFEESQMGGVNGGKLTAPNGNSIFLPDGGQVKKHYISVNEVRSDLWNALMIPVIDEGTQTAGEAPEEATTEASVVAVTESTVSQFITLLRQQTGKRFRLPTAEERRWAAECNIIDTIADAADSYGAGFHLALDTIGRAKPMMLVITAKDGTQSRYVLRTKPRVTVEKPYLIVEADGAMISFDLDELQDMRYELAPTPTDIDNVVGDTPDASPRESILFGNLPADCQLSVYNLDGKLLFSRQTGEGSLTLPLDRLDSGIYIVKLNGNTYKIQKP